MWSVLGIFTGFNSAVGLSVLSELGQNTDGPADCVYGEIRMIEVTGDDGNVHRHPRPRV